MIRIFPSNSKTAPRTLINSRAFACAAAFGAVLTVAIPAPDAFGQTGYLARDPNVSVNMGVLEELGMPSTGTGRYQPADIVDTPPVLFPPPTMPVSKLTGPLLSRRFSSAPAPRLQAPAPRFQAPASRTTVAPPPPVARVQPPTPVPLAPAKVEVRAAEPVAPQPPTPVPPAPIVAAPPPPALAPDPAPQEKVAVTAPPPAAPAPPPPAPKEEETAAAPPPPAPAVEEAPKEEAKAPEPDGPPPPTPALTPSPTGPVPAAPVQTASRPDAITDQPLFRVLFDEKSAKISDTARPPLEELSNKMKESENLRVQLLAYAEGTAETASQARRLSLSRALAVRSFLINQGVRSTRMDVRALGNKSPGGPVDRVDAVLVER